MPSVYLTQFNDGVQSGEEVSAGDFAILTDAGDRLLTKLNSHLANGWTLVLQQATLFRVSKVSRGGSTQQRERLFQIR